MEQVVQCWNFNLKGFENKELGLLYMSFQSNPESSKKTHGAPNCSRCHFPENRAYTSSQPRAYSPPDRGTDDTPRGWSLDRQKDETHRQVKSIGKKKTVPKRGPNPKWRVGFSAHLALCSNLTCNPDFLSYPLKELHVC